MNLKKILSSAALLIAGTASLATLSQAQTLSGSSLSFGQGNLGTDSVQYLTLTPGSAPITGISYSVTGTNSGYFAVNNTSSLSTGACVASKTDPVTQACNIYVVFTPGAVSSSLSANLTVNVTTASGTTPLPAVSLSGSSIEPYCDAAASAYGSAAGSASPVYPDTPVVKMMAAGSSAMWATMGLAAYNGGQGITGAVQPTYHWVGANKAIATDSRVSPVATDSGSLWLVWDSATKGTTYSYTNYAGKTLTSTKCLAYTPNVWGYANLDSVVGNRLFFGGQGTIGAPFNTTSGAVDWTAGGSLDAANKYVWGNCSSSSTNCDTAVPLYIQNLFTTGTGVLVNVGATDIRPEDAFYATQRVNALLGSGSDSRDNLEGLGYGINAVNTPPNTVANNCVKPTNTATGSASVGTQIVDDYAGSKFNVIAFNIHGADPITCASLRSYDIFPVGATPVTFVYSNNLKTFGTAGLQDVSEDQVQQVFGGQNVNVSAFGLSPNSSATKPAAQLGQFAAYLREPLSGTYNTIEQTIFRHPSSLTGYRMSQETNAICTPGKPCISAQMPNNPTTKTGINGGDVSGLRYRAIGTGNEVNSVKKSSANHSLDGVGYTFFSFANVNPLAGSGNYGYATLNGIDPIWHDFGGGDPGQTSNGNAIGQLPANTPCGTAANFNNFPCPEALIWSSDPDLSATLDSTWTASVGGSGLSFPNLRNGSYPAWSLLRLIADASVKNEVSALVAASNLYAVAAVPDYVPYTAVTCPASGSVTVSTASGTPFTFNCTYSKKTPGILDPGLQIQRAHYGCSASNVPAGNTTLAALQAAICGTNTSGAVVAESDKADTGRDAGGSIILLGDKLTDYTQDGYTPFQY